MKTTSLQPNPPIDVASLSVFRVENFPASEQIPWLDRPDWREQLDARFQALEISAQEYEICRQWAESGFFVVRGAFEPERLDAAWAAYERAIASGRIKPIEDHDIRVKNPLPGRALNPHFQVPEMREILFDRRACELVSLVLGVTSLPFQTIAGHKGSEQLAHSDSIHMTTYPQGFLAANWIAFEDIAPTSGPLEYYPGSHRLPYGYSRDCGITLEEGRASYGAYHAKYEPYVRSQIETHGLSPSYFLAKKGDVLFWHANLLHGGSRIKDAQSSRRALVCHYFAEGCVCYHDYTGTASHLVVAEIAKREGRGPGTAMLTKDQFDGPAYLRVNPDVLAAGVDPYKHYAEFGHREGRRLR